MKRGRRVMVASMTAAVAFGAALVRQIVACEVGEPVCGMLYPYCSGALIVPGELCFSTFGAAGLYTPGAASQLSDGTSPAAAHLCSA